MRGIGSSTLLLLLVACAGDPAREADRPFTGGLAVVESLRVEVRNHSPVSAWLWVFGQLPDACTTLEPPHVQRSGSVFEIVLETRRPFGSTCAQVLTPFEKRIRLNVDPVLSGAYVVTVNGVTESFAVNVLDPGPLL